MSDEEPSKHTRDRVEEGWVSSRGPCAPQAEDAWKSIQQVAARTRREIVSVVPLTTEEKELWRQAYVAVIGRSGDRNLPHDAQKQAQEAVWRYRRAMTKKEKEG